MEPVTAAVGGLAWLVATVLASGPDSSGVAGFALNAVISGILGNEAHRLYRDRAPLAIEHLRGLSLPENHDLARAVRTAQAEALKLQLNDYNTLHEAVWHATPTTRPTQFLDRMFVACNDMRSACASKTFLFDTTVTEILRATFEGLLSDAVPGGPASLRAAALADFTENAVLLELQAALPGMAIPEDFETLFRHGAERRPRFLDLFGAFFSEQIKAREPVRAILTTKFLARIEGLAIDATEILDRIENQFGLKLDAILKRLEDEADAAARRHGELTDGQRRLERLIVDASSSGATSVQAIADIRDLLLARTLAEKKHDHRVIYIPRSASSVMPKVVSFAARSTETLIERSAYFLRLVDNAVHYELGDVDKVIALLHSQNRIDLITINQMYNVLYKYHDSQPASNFCDTIEQLFYHRLEFLPLGFPFRQFEVTPQMVKIPPGAFMMGASEDDVEAYANEKPQHQVSINSNIAVGRYPVTFSEFIIYCSACDRPPPYDEHWGYGNRPVIHVSWYDAIDYCKWLSQKTNCTYRLLSESEWEYAARSGTSNRYGAENTLNPDIGNCSERFGGTTDVRRFRANAFGLSDMLGNVWEWVSDCWEPNYFGASDDGSSVYNGSDLRCLRGGGWDCLGRNMRVTDRCRQGFDNRINNVGFRVALELATLPSCL